MVNNDFLPEDFDLEEWKLFKKYNNRMEKQSRHIDAWFVDEPNLSEEELKKRMAYNKEHLIKDTLEQIAKGVLVTEEKPPVEVKPEPVPAPPTPPEPITNAPSNGQADMLNDIANKLDRLIALAESLTEEIASQKSRNKKRG